LESPEDKRLPCFILNMASILRGRWTTTEQTISSFILNVSFLISHNPLLLLGLFFQAFYAAVQCSVLLTTQTGSIVSSWRNSSFSPEVHDGDDDVGNPYIFSSSKSDLKNTNLLIEIDDRDFAFQRESAKTVENTAHTPPLKNHPFDLQDTYKISSLGIQDIETLVAKFGGENLNIAVALKRKDIGFLQGYGRCMQLKILHCN